MKEILRRAFDEGREGRVRMIQERLDRVRDMPPEHEAELRKLRVALPPGVPQGGIFTSLTVH